jgi:hypothetical protein
MNSLMRLYKEWADYMFPKLPFEDVLKRVERLAKTQQSMRVYGRALRAAGEGEFDEAAFMTGVALNEADESLAAMSGVGAGDVLMEGVSKE